VIKISNESKKSNELTFRVSFALVGWLVTDGIKTAEQKAHEINGKVFSTEGVVSKVYTRFDVAKLFIISEREIYLGHAILPEIGKIKIIRRM